MSRQMIFVGRIASGELSVFKLVGQIKHSKTTLILTTTGEAVTDAHVGMKGYTGSHLGLPTTCFTRPHRQISLRFAPNVCVCAA